MDEEQLRHYNKPFQQAFRDLQNGPSGGVFRHKDMQLAKTADFGPWEPCEEILNYVPNIKSIKIQMITETTSLDELFAIFRSERNIGLVLLGREISRYEKPSLIVLTSKHVYYVIDPNDIELSVRILKMALETTELTIWTTNGLFEADCLYRHYGIRLQNTNFRCCLGFHLYLMKVLSCLPQRVLNATEGAASMYPERALYLARNKDPVLASFRVLVRTWLQMDDTNQFDFNPIQMVHLETRPLNGTATNIILRRCCLVLKLAEALEFFVMSELSTMNRNVLDCLTHCNDATAKIVRAAMDKDEKRKITNSIYYAHLDTGSDILEGSIHQLL